PEEDVTSAGPGSLWIVGDLEKGLPEEEVDCADDSVEHGGPDDVPRRYSEEASDKRLFKMLGARRALFQYQKHKSLRRCENDADERLQRRLTLLAPEPRETRRTDERHSEWQQVGRDRVFVQVENNSQSQPQRSHLRQGQIDENDAAANDVKSQVC